MRPAGWPVPPRPQPWFPPHSGISVPPPAPLGLVQQPLFPVQNVRPPMSTAASPGLQQMPIAPPGMHASSTPSVPLSQPLFPVVANNNIPAAQSSPFSAPVLSTSIPLSSPAELKGSIDLHASSFQGLTFLLTMS